MSRSDSLTGFEKRLGYHFRNRQLLDEALNHRSYVNEQPAELPDNERFEFLGDAVLDLVVGHRLMERYPKMKEGDLSRLRANLVNETQLAWLARQIDLGAIIRLGKGEIQSGGDRKQSILADAYEAVIAAIYLDSGFTEAFRIVDRHLAPLIERLSAPAANFDSKSQLQELVQIERGTVPTYQVVQESGPDHDKTFRVQVTINELQEEGVGKSKKMAEQNAAKKALEKLNPFE